MRAHCRRHSLPSSPISMSSRHTSFVPWSEVLQQFSRRTSRDAGEQSSESRTDLCLFHRKLFPLLDMGTLTVIAHSSTREHWLTVRAVDQHSQHPAAWEETAQGSGPPQPTSVHSRFPQTKRHAQQLSENLSVVSLNQGHTEREHELPVATHEGQGWGLLKAAQELLSPTLSIPH